MKRWIALSLFVCTYLTQVSGQSFIKSWDRNIAGLSSDQPVAFKQLPDSGYIVLASSLSGLGVDKSDANRDPSGLTSDFWLIRLDKYGNKIWDKTYGGSNSDIPSSLLVLPHGFVLGGTSSSPISGEKTDSLRGVADFWVVAVDTAGQLQWDKTIGGLLSDQLNAITLTSDFNLMLSGWTLSGSGADKVSPSYGDFDFWLVKLDLSGNFLLENTLGGLLADNCYAMVATNDGGALLAGYSNSPVSFSKSSPSRGGFDYWVVRVDSLGRKIWDKTMGGSGDDYAFAVTEHPGSSRGFLIGGDSFSGAGNEKTDSSRGADDYWLVYLLPNGSIAWDKTFGGSDFDELNAISINQQQQILISGESYSNAGGEKSENNMGAEQIWMILTDTSGQKIWDKTFFTTGHDEMALAIPVLDNCYTGINFTTADTGGMRSFMNIGGGDIWLCKLCYIPLFLAEGNEQRNLKLFPNPAFSEVILEGYEHPPVWVQLYDAQGRLIQSMMSEAASTKLDVSQITPGLYFVKVMTGPACSTGRLIKF